MSTSWSTVRLREVLKRVKDEVHVQDDQTYARLTIRMNGRGIARRDRVLGHDIGTKKQFVARSGQLILSKIDARNGAFGVLPKECDNTIITGNFWAFDADHERLLPTYFDYLTKTPLFVEFCVRASEGTTNRRYLQEDRFLAQAIRLPPLAEQRRVVARIDELEGQVQEARFLRHQCLEEARVLFEQGRASLFETASKDGVVPLEQLATLERGKFSHRPRNDPRFFGGNHPWIQIAEIERSNKFIREWNVTLNDDGLAISKMFPKGTVLVSIAATIGATGILAFDCCVPDSIVGVTPRKGTDSEFLYHYLGYVRTHLEGIAPQSAQKNVNLQILAPLPAPRLPFDEQRKIVTYLDNLQAQVDAVSALQMESASELDSLLPAILDRAFKGGFV
jgi:type I restriction enzyme S subunit